MEITNAFDGNTPDRDMVIGSWGHVPNGCSTQEIGDWSIHLNSNVGDTNSQHYKKVCRSK